MNSFSYQEHFVLWHKELNSWLVVLLFCFCFIFVVAFFVNSRKNIVIWGKKPQLRKYLHQIARRQVCGEIFLIIDWWRRVISLGMGISLGVWFWVLQESKQNKLAEVNQKGEFCYTFFFSFCLQFFSWIPTLTSSSMDCNWNCKPIKLFPQIIFGHVAYNKDGRQMKTCPYFHHVTLHNVSTRELLSTCVSRTFL